jgi:excisionase family DNA binding protein
MKTSPIIDTSNARLGHTIAAATQATGLGRTSIYEAIKSGALKARKFGRRTIILDTELREWLAALPTTKGG